MLKPGVYIHIHEKYGQTVGTITLNVKETQSAFKFELIKNTVRYDAPQIDDMFRDKNTVTIKKNGSKHALTVLGDDWFCLYPYRVGVPYSFSFIGDNGRGD